MSPPCCFLFGRRQSGIRTSGSSGSIIDVFDGKAPDKQFFVGRVALLQFMDITEGMRALLSPLGEAQGFMAWLDNSLAKMMEAETIGEPFLVGTAKPSPVSRLY